MEEWEKLERLRLIIFSAMESMGYVRRRLSHCENWGMVCGILLQICLELHMACNDIGCEDLPAGGTPAPPTANERG